MGIIKEILRHKKVSTTERYVGRSQELRPALKLISSKKVASKEKKELEKSLTP